MDEDEELAMVEVVHPCQATPHPGSCWRRHEENSRGSWSKRKKELEKVLEQKKKLEEQNAILDRQKNEYFLQLQSTGDTQSDLEEKLEMAITQKAELLDSVKELEAQIKDLEGGSEELAEKKKAMEDKICRTNQKDSRSRTQPPEGGTGEAD